MCLLLKISCLNFFVSRCISTNGLLPMVSFSSSNICRLFATAVPTASPPGCWWSTSCIHSVINKHAHNLPPIWHSLKTSMPICSERCLHTTLIKEHKHYIAFNSVKVTDGQQLIPPQIAGNWFTLRSWGWSSPSKFHVDVWCWDIDMLAVNWPCKSMSNMEN